MNVAQAETMFGEMLDGNIRDEDATKILIEIADRGESIEEIIGAARAMRARMIKISAPNHAIDVCGTGGDGQHSLNISTATAIVIAACEIPVAKHGNRAASSRAGGADTLEALGLDLERAGATAEETLNDLGIAFLFAQKHHPALARIAPVRKALGRRTIFNLLGPLCNPAGVNRQLIGVPSPALIPIYTEALIMLGIERAMVVSGNEGLDELSVIGSSTISTIGFSIDNERFTPEIAGLARYPAQALKGGDAAYNAKALRHLLDGEAGAYRDAVLINAAGALIISERARDWQDGVEEAAEAIDRGLAKTLVDCWIAY
jgi:anthranilate phosphoribosyltransferase